MSVQSVRSAVRATARECRSGCHVASTAFAFTSGSIICKQCTPRECGACKTRRPSREYEAASLRAHLDVSKKSCLVCRACLERGCTPRNVSVYACTECEMEYGCQRFSPHSSITTFPTDERPLSAKLAAGERGSG